MTFPIRPEDPVRNIVAISPDGTETKEFRFGPGRMGYSSGNAYRPENYVLGRIKRGPWDRDMLIAAVVWEQGSQDIAETALHRVIAVGMPENVFTLYYSTLLKMERGDHGKSICRATPLTRTHGSSCGRSLRTRPSA